MALIHIAKPYFIKYKQIKIKKYPMDKYEFTSIDNLKSISLLSVKFSPSYKITLLSLNEVNLWI